MKKRLALAGAAAVALVTSVLVAMHPAQAAVGLHISGTNVVEANGSNFIMRGTSHAHVWYTSQTSSFANIKSFGANTVRVVLSGGRWGPSTASDVANVISLCKTNRLICVLEDHDTTGYGEDGAAYTLDQAANFWIGLKSVLVGQENYVVINIGNEPIGNNNATQWTSATTSAIQKLRSNGFEHLIMVDAPNWGQDWQFVMRDNAKTVAAADPNKNTLFSIHMYGVFDTAAEITSYVSAFKTAGLPLAIGEFGFNHSDGNPDEDTIMSTAVSQGIGYLGWSWSGNGGGVEYLDQVTNFDPNQITSWGTRLFNGANGIKSTAREASIFSGQTQTPPRTSATTARTTATTARTTATTARTTAATTGPTGPAGACTATYKLVNSWPGGFQAQVDVTASGSINGWTVKMTLPSGVTIGSLWNGVNTGTSGAVSVKNAPYNANAPTNFGFVANGSSSTAPSGISCTSP